MSGPAFPRLSLRALQGAVEVAEESGLRVERPLVLGDRSNLLVHLRPAPVVARVATATATMRVGDAWLAREVAVASYLTSVGAPVVAPAREIAAGPRHHDGLVLTFWEYVEELDQPADSAEAGRRLRLCREALTDFDMELPRMGLLFRSGSRCGAPRAGRLDQPGGCRCHVPRGSDRAGRCRAVLTADAASPRRLPPRQRHCHRTWPVVDRLGGHLSWPSRVGLGLPAGFCPTVRAARSSIDSRRTWGLRRRPRHRHTGGVHRRATLPGSGLGRGRRTGPPRWSAACPAAIGLAPPPRPSRPSRMIAT
jgi:hypothetical protein